MKNQHISKFALSLVCAAILSACGGSSSSSPDTTTPSVVDQNQAKIAALLEAAKTSNTAAALGLTDEQLAAFANAQYANIDATNADAVKAALEAYKAEISKANQSKNIDDRVDVSNPFTNFQITKNNVSNVGLDDTSKTTSDAMSFSVGQVQLHPSFDTIVVATPKAGASVGKTAYLEDFQFNLSSNIDGQLLTALGDLGFDSLTTYQNATSVINENNGYASSAASDYITAGDNVGKRVALAISKAAAKASTSAYKSELAAQIRQAKRDLVAAEKQYKTSGLPADLLAVNKQTAVVAILELGYENVKNVSVETYNVEGKKTLAKAILAPVVTEVKDGSNYFYTFTDKGMGIAAKAAGTAAANSAVSSLFTALGANGRTTGTHTFDGIYFDQSSTLGGTDRTSTKQPDTETNTQGTDTTAKAYVYQTGRRIYVTALDQDAADKMTYVATDSATNNDIRVLEDTAAEVYGNKTFTYEMGHGSVRRYDMVNDGGANLPLANRFLSRVQYGRVTSKLHNVDPSDLKDGVLTNTVVASFGKYGEDGTENIYFSRGSDHITADSLKALGSSGKLNYTGHAVAYGLDNSYDGRDVNAIPNAIGSTYKLYSGNHVAAEVDLASKEVSGNIFNKWTDFKYDSKGNLNQYNVNLVDFKGTLADNGNITGTSALTYGDKDPGVFAAAIYGQNAEELGGAVFSDNKAADKAWGASFGAARVESKAAAVSSPWDPKNEVR